MNNNLKAIGLIFLMAFFIMITAFKKEAPATTDYVVVYSKSQIQFRQTIRMNIAIWIKPHYILSRRTSSQISCRHMCLNNNSAEEPITDIEANPSTDIQT